MKVLHVSFSDARGGAFVAAHRIHRAVLSAGVESELLVQVKHTDDTTVRQLSGGMDRWLSRLRRVGELAVLKCQRTPNPAKHSLNMWSSGLVRQLSDGEHDVVHLHWIHREMLSVAEIGRIVKPMVWTFHDEWAYRGAEHYGRFDVDDARHREAYEPNNRLPGHVGLDLDRWTWLRKDRHWSDLDLTIVTASNWMGERARESRLFADTNVWVIPHPIETDVFAPMHGRVMCDGEAIPRERPVVAFGAIDPTSSPLKGFNMLQAAVHRLVGEVTNLLVVVFGADHGPGIETFGCEVRYTGYMEEKESLAGIYSAADVVVVPSLLEAFGQTAAEALACGTPVVAFRIGGPIDIVDHGRNGYLATPYDVDDLKKGILWALENTRQLGRAAREKVLAEYQFERIGRKYRAVYEQVRPGP